MKQLVSAAILATGLLMVQTTGFAAEMGYSGFEDFVLETPFNGAR